MFAEFNAMPKDARIWIYQADRSFDSAESAEIYELCKQFVQQWTAHGADLKGSCMVAENRFLIISVDEKAASASGCSIDSSVHFVQKLATRYSVDFFDRNQILFQLEDGTIVSEHLSELKTGNTKNKIGGSTITFNNLVKNIGEFESGWKIPVSESWLSRYFKEELV